MYLANEYLAPLMLIAFGEAAPWSIRPVSAWASRCWYRSPWNAVTPAPSLPPKRTWSSCRRSGTQSAYSATRIACCGSLRGSCAMLRDQWLATLAGVRRLTSSIVMKRIVENRPLPIAT